MSESSTHFVAVCPNCLVTLKVKEGYSGHYVRCKHCDQKFRALAPDFLVPTTPSSEEYAAGPIRLDEAEEDRISVDCPTCSTPLSVRKSYVGQYVRCKKCTEKFLVPNVVSPTPAGGFARAQEEDADLFSQIYRELDRPDDEAQQPAHGVGIVETGSHSEIRTLAGEEEGPEALLRVLQDRVAATEAARDAAMAQIETLRGDNERLRRERDELRSGARHDQAARDAEQERTVQALQSESQGLRGRVAELEAKARDRGELAADLARREGELRESAERIEAMGQQLGSLEESRALLESQQESARSEIEELREGLRNALAERDGFREQVGTREQALAGSEARIQGLTEQLRRQDEDRLALIAEVERLRDEHRAATEAADREREERAGREQALCQERDRLAAEVEELRGRVAESEQARRDEQGRSHAILRQAEEGREGLASENGSLQARLQELLALQERERAEHQRMLADRAEELRAEHASALEAERARFTDQLGQTEARCREAAELADRLKAEILTLAQARSAPDLEAARMEIDDLRLKLAETETTKKSMSSLLEGMGIRLH
jgi:DNA-directed RNA polymerase subunit RPC12/RpoP